MIRKLLAGIVAILIIASPANAQAVPAVKHRTFDKKFLVWTALSVGASIAVTATLTRCRHDHGIGPCTDGGYGEYKTREVLRQGLTGFLILPAYKIKKIEDEDGSRHKFWWLLPAFNTGANATIIAQNALKRYGPREKD